MRQELALSGYNTAHGLTLDWHYVAKLARKVRTDNLVSLSRENRMTRLAALKERHRALTEKLTDIVEGKPAMTFNGAIYPTHRERIAAANTILKWDMALIFAEEQINELNHKEQPKKELTETKTVILMNSVSETKQIPEFARS